MTGIIEEMQDVVMEVTGDKTLSATIVHHLIKKLGGCQLYLPHNDYEKRNLEIKALKREGANTKQLATRYKLHERTIRRILES